jgi:hypothetical protein
MPKKDTASAVLGMLSDPAVGRRTTAVRARERGSRRRVAARSHRTRARGGHTGTGRERVSQQAARRTAGAASRGGRGTADAAAAIGYCLPTARRMAGSQA